MCSSNCNNKLEIPGLRQLVENHLVETLQKPILLSSEHPHPHVDQMSFDQLSSSRNSPVRHKVVEKGGYWLRWIKYDASAMSRAGRESILFRRHLIAIMPELRLSHPMPKSGS